MMMVHFFGGKGRRGRYRGDEKRDASMFIEDGGTGVGGDGLELLLLHDGAEALFEIGGEALDALEVLAGTK